VGPIAALATAAAITTTLNVGPLVFDCDFRHPAVLARELATIDLLSEGRLEVGLGAGWNTLEHPFRDPDGPAEGAGRPLVLVGSAAEVSERLAERRQRWGYSHTVIPGAQARDFAPLVAALTGT
jgi:alkanesulfonate monooxygenase SsuD/methylene tetrahydromethanopterin reductase-like flavin-dependent oxidoreductase (luciferase family)